MKAANLILIAILCCIAFVFTTCKKVAEPANQNQNQNPVVEPTKIKVNVKDEAGNNVADAKVTFYAAGTPVDTQMSDSNGNVLFTINQLGFYCSWIARKGCKSNWNENFSTSIVYDHVFNSFNTIIYETGTLKLVITDTATYTLACSVYTGQIGGHGPSTNHFFPYAGAFAFHSEKTYVPGTAKDTIVQIACGDTTTIILPY